MNSFSSTISNLMLVGAGGFCGAVCRYFAAMGMQKLTGILTFPVGTLGVNVIGCFVLGLLGGLADNYDLFTPEFRLLAMVGFLGSFTTFSSFSYETLKLFNDNEFGLVILNIGMQLVFGFIAVWIGYRLTMLRAIN